VLAQIGVLQLFPKKMKRICKCLSNHKIF